MLTTDRVTGWPLAVSTVALAAASQRQPAPTNHQAALKLYDDVQNKCLDPKGAHHGNHSR